MYIIFGLLILLGSLFVVLVILGNFLPSKWTIEKVAQISAEKEKIFPYLNMPENWPEWSVWNNDNDFTFSYTGPPAGAGAKQQWKGRQMNGLLTITAIDSNKQLEFTLSIDDGKFLVNGLLVLDATMPSYTQVAWRSSCEVSKTINPILKYQAYFLKNYFELSMIKSLEGLQLLFK